LCVNDLVTLVIRSQLSTMAETEDGQRLTIHTPLIALTKREIIERGLALGIDCGLTLSCYDPSPTGLACGACDACLLRQKGFAELGLLDPAASPALTR
jgi:7-cyano-7-deazaguanine synthase